MKAVHRWVTGVLCRCWLWKRRSKSWIPALGREIQKWAHRPAFFCLEAQVNHNSWWPSIICRLYFKFNKDSLCCSGEASHQINAFLSFFQQLTHSMQRSHCQTLSLCLCLSIRKPILQLLPWRSLWFVKRWSISPNPSCLWEYPSWSKSRRNPNQESSPFWTHWPMKSGCALSLPI